MDTRFDFSKDQAEGRGYTNLKHRLIFLRSRQREFYEQEHIEFLLKKSLDGKYYAESIYKEIALVQELINADGLPLPFPFTNYGQPPVTTENKPTKIQNKKTKLSYQWNDNAYVELPELWKRMKKMCIAKKTKYTQFQAVFTGQPLDKIEAIKWHDKNCSELLYFNKVILNYLGDNRYHKFGIMSECFVDNDGKKFTQSFRTLNKDLEFNLSEDKRKAIDSLIIGL